MFPDRAALAAEAQTQWWQRLLGRLDATLNEDLAGIPCDAVANLIQQAWYATTVELPGYLALVASAAGTATVRRGTQRYAGLLALFAGEAAVDDGPLAAARTGMQLVEQMSSAAVAPAEKTATWAAGATVAAVTGPWRRARRMLGVADQLTSGTQDEAPAFQLGGDPQEHRLPGRGGDQLHAEGSDPPATGTVTTGRPTNDSGWV